MNAARRLPVADEVCSVKLDDGDQRDELVESHVSSEQCTSSSRPSGEVSPLTSTPCEISNMSLVSLGFIDRLAGMHVTGSSPQHA